MNDTRIVIAFSEPPRKWRFTRARSGKCWVRTVKSRDWAVKLGQSLADIGIHGIIKKCLAKQARQTGAKSITAVTPRDPHNPRARASQGGFGGRLQATPIKGSWRIRKRRR